MLEYNNYALRLPSYLFRQVKSLAKEEHISVNQLINLALAEKMAALQTLDYLKKRAARGKSGDLLAVLKKSKAKEPPREGDELM